MSEREREPHAGGEQEQRPVGGVEGEEEQEQRPVGGVEGEEEQEVAQGERAREREREVKSSEAERSEGV
jgi:hypothetical protein